MYKVAHDLIQSSGAPSSSSLLLAMSLQSLDILNPSIVGSASIWDDVMEVDGTNTTPPATNSMQPPPKSRKRKARTLRDSDWQQHRSRISGLYTTGMTLKDIMTAIETETGFHAETRQYKFRISQWRLDKNVKTREMQALVRKRQQRKLVEVDKPKLIFEVRGNEVDAAKIDRWMQAHDVSESAIYAPSPAATTPSAIVCRTASIPNKPRSRSSTPLSAGESDMSTSTTQPTHVAQHPFHRLRSSQAITEPFINIGSVASTVSSGSFYYGLNLDQFAQLQSVWHSFIDVVDQEPILDYSQLTSKFDTFKKVMDPHLDESGFLQQLDRLFTGCNVDLLGRLWLKNKNKANWHFIRDVLSYFLSIGCDLEHRNLTGKTPFLTASTNGSMVEYLSLLVELGANINATDYLGRGALHFALINFADIACSLLNTRVPSWTNQAERLKMGIAVLLEAGCDPDAKDLLGKAPIDYAQDITELLDIWTNALAKSKHARDPKGTQEFTNDHGGAAR